MNKFNYSTIFYSKFTIDKTITIIDNKIWLNFFANFIKRLLIIFIIILFANLTNGLANSRKILKNGFFTFDKVISLISDNFINSIFLL